MGERLIVLLGVCRLGKPLVNLGDHIVSSLDCVHSPALGTVGQRVLSPHDNKTQSELSRGLYALTSNATVMAM
jgi:hypothetical protein